mmetsp:Transcript_14962/g.32634  ORF Transcript_14962/g.32634 Transcript_14962/m.32634 type:complete len:161 (+) Transcript_14962:37-519(+)|eukprot:CAMPEP_0172526076 /NCGR_PEP_ID=MMETSP1067-20121228/1088_1 /TAXON_ID=265564 ORGANISM="Thalassiosira punctigera, Strain Tpunct2005C2" /NCGR_SAMPLE_ID=MMETSP1067 /ASSEMBLY_ACC=CAM_ASM_000444 /LENGTH=160 /DNA_ID=CAMNT_0013309513 /DNA_START=30 /DNA_END=512 /DNA_ORIENTATION=+
MGKAHTLPPLTPSLRRQHPALSRNPHRKIAAFLCALVVAVLILRHAHPNIAPSSLIVMGNKSSAPKEVRMLSEDVVEVSLLKRRPGCTGMFWRKDPTGETKLASNNDWPRDGAKLKGKVVEVDGKKWLLATEVMQKGKDWVNAPEGAAMPFEHDNHYYLE